MRIRTTTKYICIHCSYTKPSMDFVDAEWLRNIHVNEKGFSDIGYHFVIKRDGVVETGRDLNLIGAHERKINRESIAIVLVGGMDENNNTACNYTSLQIEVLTYLLKDLELVYSDAKIVGHNEFSDKPCPCFDVQKFMKSGNLIEVLK